MPDNGRKPCLVCGKLHTLSTTGYTLAAGFKPAGVIYTHFGSDGNTCPGSGLPPADPEPGPLCNKEKCFLHGPHRDHIGLVVDVCLICERPVYDHELPKGLRAPYFCNAAIVGEANDIHGHKTCVDNVDSRVVIPQRLAIAYGALKARAIKKKEEEKQPERQRVVSDRDLSDRSEDRGRRRR